MTEDDLLEAIYEKGGKKPMGAVSTSELQKQFGSEFPRLIEKLDRRGYLQQVVGQVWLTGPGLDRAEQLFD